MKIIYNFLLLLAVDARKCAIGRAANITSLPKECAVLVNATVSRICLKHSPEVMSGMQSEVFQIETTTTNPYIVSFNTSELPKCFAQWWFKPFLLHCLKDSKGKVDEVNLMHAVLYCRAVFDVAQCGQDDLHILPAERFVGFRGAHAAPRFVPVTWYTVVGEFFWYFLIIMCTN